ncbi:hypothetical protein [Neobacillus piezotolerans]|uniref:hypothetical protein n=1 Tax=Neobacillus piezotolerans TaxID=2259171 RepID=UPI0015F18355|nr:hypothetical protein [Neobacillus piezotolerans]
MHKRSFLRTVLFLAAFALVMAGCSGKKVLLDEQGKEVSLENKDKPSLVFFFTGNT